MIPSTRFESALAGHLSRPRDPCLVQHRVDLPFMCSFLKASESEGLIGTPLEFCAEQLLVHLDDPSAEIQMAVFDALRQMICFDQLAAMAVANKIKDVHASHRDPSLCHQLLKEAALHDKSP